MSSPALATGPLPADEPSSVTWQEFSQAARQFDRTGRCTHPIRLSGRIAAIDLATGELRSMYDTASDEPGGVLHVPCGNRRESVCKPCSAVYKRDARQLVRAGLTGGKGIPETIAEHPCVFTTFTAPSFGPVHSRRMKGPHRPAVQAAPGP